MPKYTYKCANCDTVITLYHGMKTRAHDCDQCGHENSLQRVMSKISLRDEFTNKEKPVGSIVKKFIEDAKEEIELEKRVLRNNDRAE